VKVYEQFVSFQGEGPSMGIPAFFCRFAGCQLRCWFCDTKLAWKGENVVPVEFPAGLKLTVITGGEPLWGPNRANAYAIAQEALLRGMRVEVETNGLEGWFDEGSGYVRYIVSPKLFDLDLAYSVVSKWVMKKDELDFVFKFVVDTPDDLLMVKDLVGDFYPYRVWIMPQGIDSTSLIEKSKLFTDFVLERRWNLSSRLHVFYGIR